MTIKSKISLYISIIFTVLFGIICISVYSLFSNFRKQEFTERLEEKAKSNIKLLQELKTVNVRILNALDKRQEDQLHKDQTLIFNGDYELIYATRRKNDIQWTKETLRHIQSVKKWYWSKGELELFGLYYPNQHQSYIAIIAAKDSLGIRKMNFLRYSLLGAYLIFTLAAWLISFLIIKRQLKPLDDFHHEITRINEQNLNESFVVPIQSKNEIHLLSNEFNHMIQRISKAYQKQKEFTSQASHELRTPLARMSSQIENQLTHVDDEQAKFLKKQLDEVTQLNELISSLLILSKMESKQNELNETCRLDEIVYNCIEKVTRVFPLFKVHLEFDNSEDLSDALTIRMNAQLLEIAIGNLLKNAWVYGNEKAPIIKFGYENQRCYLQIVNKGKLLKESEIDLLYEPFMRGENAKNKEGLGLGLRIVYRILQIYGYQIAYSKQHKSNCFRITF
ncbi:MAG: sensor histidine kinase [Flavobacteriales bacterium]